MKPIVGMVADEALPEPLLGLLDDIFSRARPVAFERGSGAPMHAAVVASRRCSRPRLPAFRSPSGPTMPTTSMHLSGSRRRRRSSPRCAASSRRRREGVEVPAAPRPMPDVRPVAPAVRADVRRGRGSRSVQSRFSTMRERIRGADGPSRKARKTPRACASVVWRAVTSPWRDGWGAPIVTDAATHRDLEFVPGQDAVVAGDGDVDAASAVDAVLDDEPLAAVLSWNARTFYERHFDTKYAVLDLSRKLDLVRAGPSGSPPCSASCGPRSTCRRWHMHTIASRRSYGDRGIVMPLPPALSGGATNQLRSDTSAACAACAGARRPVPVPVRAGRRAGPARRRTGSWRACCDQSSWSCTPSCSPRERASRCWRVSCARSANCGCCSRKSTTSSSASTRCR